MTVMLSGLAVIRIEMSLLEMSASDDTIFNFFPYNEGHPHIDVSSHRRRTRSCLRGSFSKPCSSDLGKAQNVPSIALELVGEPAPVLFRKHVESGRSMLLLFLLSAV